jgi:DsbC/DsbD-like thiol-disulfide interchange protein
LVLLCSQLPSFAATESHAKVELIADVRAPQAGTKLWVGLLFRLDPGWHVYWQNAGDSGEPPRIRWNLPPGFSAGAIAWPTPTRLGTGSIIDYGYENQVLLMVPIERPAAEKPGKNGAIELAADVNYLVCREICVPGKAHASLSLPLSAQSSAEATRWQTLFQQTKAQLPKQAPAGWKVVAKSSGDHFVLSVDTGIPVRKASFFPQEPNVVENSAPQEFSSARRGFQITLKKSDQLTSQASKLTGLVVVDGGRAYEISVPVV